MLNSNVSIYRRRTCRDIVQANCCCNKKNSEVYKSIYYAPAIHHDILPAARSRSLLIIPHWHTGWNPPWPRFVPLTSVIVNRSDGSEAKKVRCLHVCVSLPRVHLIHLRPSLAAKCELVVVVNLYLVQQKQLNFISKVSRAYECSTSPVRDEGRQRVLASLLALAGSALEYY